MCQEAEGVKQVTTRLAKGQREGEGGKSEWSRGSKRWDMNLKLREDTRRKGRDDKKKKK